VTVAKGFARGAPTEGGLFPTGGGMRPFVFVIIAARETDGTLGAARMFLILD